ncbi:T9SS type A sorting domain-containing protein [Pontibacter sp. G13]|uniref:T9SS type A sorting domain-containing protein n=1 Tax=Pontibacter sp. G13 TaxID=3074898 RepID=UPI00288907AC|nr:T9SS type A sorting domain-containing protein [Pontibacter sp. G13]WNJ18917.1 T9SS type A sorting domain-containing protein [Pontibacter sp. G13]
MHTIRICSTLVGLALLFTGPLFAQPANDDLCQASLISLNVGCTGPNGDNTNATSQVSEPSASCFIGGANSVWYKFAAPVTGLVTISTDHLVGDNTDTEIALYALPNGDCTNLLDLVELACDQDGGTSSAFNSTISGAPVTPGDTFYVQVSGWSGTEGSFCLTVDSLITPSNDNLCNAIEAVVDGSCNGTPNGDNSGAGIQSGEPTPTCFNSQPHSVWYFFQAPASGLVNISTDFPIGTLTDTEIALYEQTSGDCSTLGTLNQLACDQDGGTTVSFNSLITGAIVVPGDTYYIQVSGWNGAEGSFCLQVESVQPPPNDSLCQAIALTLGAGCSGTSNGDNTGAQSHPNEPVPSCFSGGANSVWYSFQGPATGYVQISTDYAIGSLTDSEMALYLLPNGDCTDLSDLIELECDQDAGVVSSFNSVIVTSVTPNETYYIQVSGWNGAEGTFCVTVDGINPPPANDTLCNALPITVGTSCAGTPNVDNTNTSLTLTEPLGCAAGATNSIWYTFVAPPSGYVNIKADTASVGGTNGQLAFHVYDLQGDCTDFNNLVSVGCEVLDLASDAALDTLPVTPGETYYLQVLSLAFGTFCLEIEETIPTFIPSNDNVCQAISLPVDGSYGVYSNLNATLQSGESALNPPPGNGQTNDGWFVGDTMIQTSVWFSFVAPQSGSMSIDLCNGGSANTTFDTQIALYSTTDCQDFGTFTWLFGNDDNPNLCPSPTNNYASYMEVECLTPGETYYILVDGFDGETGSFEIGLAPIITDPLVLSGFGLPPTCLGTSSGSVSVAVKGGSQPYRYSWNTGDTVSLIENVPAGPYTVVVTDACNAVDSASILLPNPQGLVADAGPDQIACDGTPVQLGGNPTAVGGYPFPQSRGYFIESNFNTGVQTFSKAPLRRLSPLQGISTLDTLGNILAGDFVEGVFVGIDDDNRQLVLIDTSTGLPTLIPGMAASSNDTWTGLAYDRTSSTLYATTSSGSSSTLYTVDLFTATPTPIGVMNISVPIWLAIDTLGNLFTLNLEDDQLYSVNSSTGFATAIGPVGFDANFPQDADFDERTNRLYTTAFNGDAFSTEYREISTDTGLSNLISQVAGPINYPSFAISPGIAPVYTYDWTPSIGLDDSSIANPMMNQALDTEFVLSVTDACGTTRTDTVSVSASVISLVLSANPDDGSGNGAATVNISGGNPPYDILWSNGSATSTISGLDQGTYTVSVTDSTGCNKTDSIEVTGPVSIDPTDLGISEYQLFPVPATTVLQVQVTLVTPGKLSLVLVDIQGRSVRSQAGDHVQISHQHQLSVEGLASGFYTLYIQTESGIFRQKISIK